MRSTKSRSTQSGFTLIELVVVIVILGILAATAIPRFTNMSTQARIASANGLYAAVQSASAIAHAQALANNTLGATGTITLEGATVNVVFGYPATAAGGIDSALSSFTGYTFAAGVFSQTGATTPATCGATYAQPTAANTSPAITLNTAGC